MKNSQVIPLTLTFVVFGFLTVLLYATILIVNRLVPQNPIMLEIKPADVLVGITIYLKTAIDFAIFIGRLMHSNNSMKGRIAIEIGTAIGNAIGTILVVLIWVLVKEVPALLALMIFVASLVLLELGESGLEHLGGMKSNKFFERVVNVLEKFFEIAGKFYKPILSKIMPDISEKIKGAKTLNFKSLLIFSITIPFILGLDDFAGYVSLFSLINIFGFGIGVFAGHLFLNIALFANPNKTIQLVKNKWVALLGTIAFIILSVIGFSEVIRLVVETIH